MDVVVVDGGSVVAGFGRVDLDGVNNSKIVKGRGRDKDGCPLFLF